jgi:radical SAM superfamily enzyme YgiQ (UPF0313 family)
MTADLPRPTYTEVMKVLLVYPRFPKTYWGMEYTQRLIGRKALLPPLGLLTVAALLPRDFEPRLIDMNVEPLRDADLTGTDIVFLSAMHVQRESYDEVIRRAHALGKRVVVGGPYVTTDPDASAEADSMVLGEAEDLIAQVCADLSRGELQRRYQAAERPDVTRSPVPRFDLLKVHAYSSLGVQFSRGCPFQCEFCDIIEIFGRVPRTKPPAQLIAELEALRMTGFRGSVFVVDDNFIGNKGAARRLLPELTRWMESRKHPFELFTEASVNLAAEDELVAEMVRAGFTAVFLGIETPSSEALAETKKRQNLHLDLGTAVEKLTRAGLEVMAGFIVGFDADDEGIFDRQQRFIQSAPIPLAMVGILAALPSTQLWRRLEREGRLRTQSNGNVFGRTNFETRLPEETVVRGYAKLLGALYDPAAYFARCERTLELLPAKSAAKARWGIGFALKVFVRSLLSQGLRSKYRSHYWRFLVRVLTRQPRHLVRAIALAVKAEHLIRYTHEDVLPALQSPRPAIELENAHRPARLPAEAPLGGRLVTIGGK